MASLKITIQTIPGGPTSAPPIVILNTISSPLITTEHVEVRTATKVYTFCMPQVVYVLEEQVP